MWALVVKTCGLSFQRRRPQVAEVMQDRPKTLFTKTRQGENYYHKDLIRYRLFDTKEEAEAALPQIIRANLEYEESMEQELRRVQEALRKEIDSLVAGDDWSGGR